MLHHASSCFMSEWEGRKNTQNTKYEINPITLLNTHSLSWTFPFKGLNFLISEKAPGLQRGNSLNCNSPANYIILFLSKSIQALQFWVCLWSLFNFSTVNQYKCSLFQCPPTGFWILTGRNWQTRLHVLNQNHVRKPASKTRLIFGVNKTQTNKQPKPQPTDEEKYHDWDMHINKYAVCLHYYLLFSLGLRPLFCLCR